MKEKLKNELNNIGITLFLNTLNPEFSDYVIKYNERIVGYGWKRENIKEKVGFMGWSAPAWENCVWRTSSTPKNLNFKEVISLFQFAVSDDYIWFSLPANDVIIGYSCEPFQNVNDFISNLKLFIENEFNPRIF
jgi:hypothetical protein